MKKSLLMRLVYVLLASFSIFAHAADEPLLPDQAFKFEAKLQNETTLRAIWTIAGDVYVYADKISFSSGTPGIKLGDYKLPKGDVKTGLRPDGSTGPMEVFHKSITVDIPFTRTDNSVTSLELIAKSQGCAEKFGVCYPPQTRKISLLLKPGTAMEKSSAVNRLSSFSQSVGAGADDAPLTGDQAFKANVSLKDKNTLHVTWEIAEGYYVYRDKTHFEITGSGAKLGTVELPAGKKKHGITPEGKEGEVDTFTTQIALDIPFTVSDKAISGFRFVAHSQGCSEARGLCYPPQQRHFNVDLKSGTVVVANKDEPFPATAAVVTASTPAQTLDDESLTSQERIANKLVDFVAHSSLFVSLFAFLGVGLLVAFTACMYPMIPIVTSIIAGQGEKTTVAKSFSLSFFYVLAFALVFAVIGGVMGYIGEKINVQVYMQNPIVLSVFAVMFVALSMSMFGFYNIQMPSGIQSKLTELSGKQEGGKLAGVFFMGAISALIIGPCGGPITLAVISLSAASNSALLGSLYMLLFGFGMGLPLLLVGAGGGTLLPRAGDWMNVVKASAGVLLLGVALFMLASVLPQTLYMLLWAALLMIVAVYMGAFDRIVETQTGWFKLWKGIGIVVFIYGLIVMLGGLTGARNVLDPLHGSKLIAQSGGFTPTAVAAPTSGGSASVKQAQGKQSVIKGGLTFIKIKTAADFQRELAAANSAKHTVMIDFYADWCIYCKQFDDYVFAEPKVQSTLSNTVLLQADVTNMDNEDLALIKHLNAPPQPPAILFFGTDGKEAKFARIVGLLDADKFALRVKKAFTL